ncbi:MAG: phage virion morphogenesis protein [Thermodesulfobacteriota bacterium]|nr:MAG: phage virion morphogenesis protein [Thermodesulfobacteriota bacterium]
MDINIKMDLAGVRDLFRRLRKAGGDLTPVMKRIGATVTQSVKRNFREGGRPERWAPLSMATLFAGKKSKFVTKRGRFRKGVEEKFRNRKVLIKESHLMGSVNWRASANRVEVGTNKVYAAIHQFGGEAGRKRKRVMIPARPYLMVQNEDIAEIRTAITAHIMAAEKGR